MLRSDPVFSKLPLLISFESLDRFANSDPLIKLSGHFFLTSYVFSSKFHRSLSHPPKRINFFAVPTIAAPQHLPTDSPLVITHSCRLPEKKLFARGDMC